MGNGVAYSDETVANNRRMRVGRAYRSNAIALKGVVG